MKERQFIVIDKKKKFRNKRKLKYTFKELLLNFLDQFTPSENTGCSVEERI